MEGRGGGWWRRWVATHTGAATAAEGGYANSGVHVGDVFIAAAPAFRVEQTRLQSLGVPPVDQPSLLLAAGSQVVPFFGRGQELEELRRWRDDEPAGHAGRPTRVRVLYGEGGQGKTRLAAQFAWASAQRGWAVATVRHHSDPVTGDPQVTVGGKAAGLLLVVDYADRWPPKHLKELLGHRLLRLGLPVRLLLLARSARWLPEHRTDLHKHGFEASEQRLEPLAAPGDADQRRAVFEHARDRFCQPDLYGIPPAEAAGITAPPALGGPDWGVVLTLHMAALAAVDAHTRRLPAPSDPHRLSAYLLDREASHWSKLYANASEPGGGLDFKTPPSLLRQVVFTAALTGPVPYTAGTALLAAIGARDDGLGTGRLLADHARCYPPADADTVLEPIYPDRLAEDFIALTLPGDSITSSLGDPWATSTAKAMAAGDTDTPTWSARAVIFLASAAARWPHVGTKHLYPLLRCDPALALDAGSAALTALAGIPDTGHDDGQAEDAGVISVLDAVEQCFPDGARFGLNAGIAAITQRLTDHRLARTTDPAERARLKATLAHRLANAGLRRGALEPAREAAEIYRRLARAEPEAEPGAYLPDLAMSLNNLGALLSEVGDRQAALGPAREAAEIYRRLAEAEPGAYLPDLAMSLNNLGIGLSEVGDRQAALGPAREAVAIRRRLAEAEPGAYLPDLAMSLNSLGIGLSEVGDRQAALGPAREAVEIYRRLAEAEPGAYLPDLAMSLNNLGVGLSEVGDRQAALGPAREAVAIYRRLAEAEPGAYLPNLAMSLWAFAAIRIAAVVELDQAVVDARTAVEIFASLAQQLPDAYAGYLRDAQAVLADGLDAVGERGEANEIRRLLRPNENDQDT